MIYYLLVVYQIKHWLADYPLQGRYMLGKFQPWPKFVLPLLSHALVHAWMTFTIVFFVKPDLALQLAAFDFAAHAVIDWIKANPSIGGRYAALSKTEMKGILERSKADQSTPADQAAVRSNKNFWMALGADQTAHHLTHYAIIWVLCGK